MRARAVSRFYIALPLSSVVTGALAGWLMGLQGTLGLAGWQWLFLVEGIPSALYSFVILFMLPDGPGDAAWLTDAEKSWLRAQLAVDGDKAHLGHDATVLQALLSPKVWMIGLYFFGMLTCSYGFGFSAPAILQEITGWGLAQVGYLIAAFGVAGAACMLLVGTSSDRRGERKLHCMVPCLLTAAGFLAASFATPPWLVVLGLFVSFSAFMGQLGPAVALPTEFLAGRAAAAGIAAMNTITMFSGFVGPYWMGVMKDATGSYWAGLRGLVIPALGSAVIMFLLTRSLARGALAIQAAKLADGSA
jgi:ACS family tartrate transporter-like MFS transporter